MTLGSALLLGLGLGLRHAADADHLLVIGALIQRRPGPAAAARVAVAWGLGHSATFLGVGLLIVLAGLRVPDGFDRVAELLVAAMLIGIGVWNLVRGPSQRSHHHDHDHDHDHHHAGTESRGRWRAAVAGLLHGLAGSATIALAALTTIRSPTGAALYLLVFGAATVAAMAGLTVLMSWPIRWTLGRPGLVPRLAILVASLLGIAVGVMLAVESIAG